VGAGDDRLDQRDEAGAQAQGGLLPDQALGDGVGEAAILALDRGDAPDQSGDGVARVGGRKRLRRDGLELDEALLEDRLDEVVLGREVPVERGGADTGAAGDPVDPDLQAVLAVRGARGVDQGLAVAGGVGAADGGGSGDRQSVDRSRSRYSVCAGRRASVLGENRRSAPSGFRRKGPDARTAPRPPDRSRSATVADRSR
jgi:hypothetical protein